MSGEREGKPDEPATPEVETEDDLRQAVEEEDEHATAADDGEPDLEPEEGADPEPLRRTREERDRLREERRELEEETRQRRALLERETLSRPRVDPARQAELEQLERERVAQMPLHEQFEYWEAKAAQRQAQAQAETTDAIGRMQFDQRVRELQLPYSYRLQAENLMAEYRAQGMNATWDYVLTQTMGRYWLDQAPEREREIEEQRERGQRRIASQTVRPGGRGSTAATASRREQDQEAADKALLMSITWGEANR